MLDQLKRLAMQQLMNKMAGNKLGQSETQQAAEHGANGLMETITGALSGGGAGQLKDLLSNNGNASQDNSLFQNIQSKIQEALQAQGMTEDEAKAEAAETCPHVIDGMKAKFESEAEEDKGFDLGDFTKLAEGGIGNILQNSGGLMNAAKNILGK